MYRLMRFYNQNRKAIIRAILIIALFFVILIIFNNNKKNNYDTLKINTNTEKIKSDSVTTDRSIITGEEIESNKINKDVEVIEEFINFCKLKDVKNAYSLLSNSCKELQFKSESELNNIYFEIFFKNSNIIYTIENWYNDTYKITIRENALSTGKISQYEKQDYITIVEENGEKRLNINNFLYKKDINSKKNFNEIEVNIVSEQQYMDYLILDIEIKNNMDFQILMDDLQEIKSVYIQDDNESKYSLYTHEFEKNELLILPKESKKIKLKFYSKYISTKNINKLVFSNVIINFGTESEGKKMSYSIEI